MTGSIVSAVPVALALLAFGAGHGNVWIFFGGMISVGLGNGLVLPNAIAGMVSVRPNLAGSASGLGGAIMIGGGAALSALAGTMLTPQNGAMVLLWMMLLSLVAGHRNGDLHRPPRGPAGRGLKPDFTARVPRVTQAARQEGQNPWK